MARTIVVPLDRSEVAESALPFAIQLARETSAPLVLLSVVDMPLELAAWLDATNIIDQKIEVEEAYEDYLEDIAEDITAEVDDITIDIAVRIGSAANEIERYVEALKEPIVVMASHGRTGVRRLIVGSVTQQVVHRLRTPVIVVPAHMPEDDVKDALLLESLLFPLDGSEFAAYALETALDLLGDRKPHLHLMRVVEVVSWYGGPYSGMDFYGLDPYIDSARDTAAEYLDQLAGELRENGYTVTTEVRVGLVADQIDAVAASRESDLIVMATHGRSGVGRLIFGSVAERALRQAPVPLMLVRPDRDLSETPTDLADSMVAVKA